MWLSLGKQHKQMDSLLQTYNSQQTKGTMPSKLCLMVRRDVQDFLQEHGDSSTIVPLRSHHSMADEPRKAPPWNPPCYVGAADCLHSVPTQPHWYYVWNLWKSLVRLVAS